MKRDEIFKNLLFTVAVILLSGIFVALFTMTLLIQSYEHMPMSNIWVIGIAAFLATVTFITIWAIRRILPAEFSAARKTKRNDPFSFSAILKRRIKRRFAAAKRHGNRAQPVRTTQYRQSIGSASRLIQKQF